MKHAVRVIPKRKKRKKGKGKGRGRKKKRKIRKKKKRTLCPASMVIKLFEMLKVQGLLMVFIFSEPRPHP